MSEATRQSVHSGTWSRTELLLLKLLGTAAFTLLAVLSAHVRIPLPYTPVPMTLQTLIAPLVGGFLGAAFGSISMLLYVALGLLGAPVFAHATGGWQFLYAPTAGFLIGMIGAAWIMGLAHDRRMGNAGLIAMLFASNVLLFACGYLGFMWATHAGPQEAFTKAVAPFLVGDALKLTASYLALVSYNQLRKGTRLHS